VQVPPLKESTEGFPLVVVKVPVPDAADFCWYRSSMVHCPAEFVTQLCAGGLPMLSEVKVTAMPLCGRPETAPMTVGV